MEQIRPRIKLQDVAARTGVSVSTVSRVLNQTGSISESVQKQVLFAAHELGYRRERFVAQSGLQHVGLFTTLISPGQTLDAFHMEILSGVEAECKRLGIHLSYSVVERGPQSAAFMLEKIAKNDIDGLLLLSFDDRGLTERLLGHTSNIALINTEHPGLAVDSYLPDNSVAPRLLVEHLLELGHRRILHLTHRARPTIRRRHAAYRAALEAAGVPYREALVVDTHLSVENGYQTMKRLLEKKPDYSAIFCASDTLALGTARALQEAGLGVPEDVSLVGYDDIDVAAYMSPPLTTARIRRGELGARAVRGLVERALMPEEAAVRVELAVELVKRESVAVPHAHYR